MEETNTEMTTHAGVNSKINELEKDKYFRICDVLLRLEVQKGHLKWSISQVSREASVTRTLIYYYFGSTKESLLHEAFHYMLHTIYGDYTERLGLEKRVTKITAITKKNPYLFMLWYLNRGTDSMLGQMIEEKEGKILELLQSRIEGSTELDILKIYLMEVGAVGLNLEEDKIKEIFGKYNDI